MLTRSIEQVSVTIPLDPYLSLQGAASYCGLSVRYLRDRIADGQLPHYRPGGGKILLRRSEIDAWLQRFRHIGQADLDAVVTDILGDLRGESNTESAGQTSQPLRNKGMTASAPKPVAERLQNRPLERTGRKSNERYD